MYVDYESIAKAYDCGWTGFHPQLDPELVDRAKSISDRLPPGHWDVGRSSNNNIYISEVFGDLHFCLWVDQDGKYSYRLFVKDEHKLLGQGAIMCSTENVDYLRKLIGDWKELKQDLAPSFVEAWKKFKNEAL